MQNFAGPTDVTTLAGGTPDASPAARSPPRRPSRSSGTNGGGFYNANSAHPFENPTAWTNLFEIFLLLVIPFSLPRTLRPDGRATSGRATRSSP